MRVLHVTPFHARAIRMGGVAVGTGALARAQARAGAQVTVFATDVGLEGGIKDTEFIGGVAYRCFHVRQGMPFFFSGEMISTLKTCVSDFDILHIHGLWNLPVNYAARSAMKAGVPFALSPRGMLNQWAFRYRRWKKAPIWYVYQRRMVENAATLIFTTEAERREATALIEHPQTAVVPFGIGEMHGGLPAGRHGSFRARLGIEPDVPLLAYIGRIHPIKGLGVLLEAVEHVSVKVPGLQMVMAGPDDCGYKAELVKQAAQAGISDRVHWVGLVNDTEKCMLLAEADLFMFVSFSENFGLAAIEALAAGTGVVVGHGVNIATLIKEYDAGWVIPTEKFSIAEAIHEALSKPEMRRVRARRGMKLVAEQFDPDVNARKVLEIYRQCLPRGQGKPQQAGIDQQLGELA